MPPVFSSCRRRALRILWTVCCLGWGGPRATVGADAFPEISDGGQGDVEINAEAMRFERSANLVYAEGNVTITRDAVSLRADRVVMHTLTSQALATGNVVFKGDDLDWTGERFLYNFETGRWASGEFISVVHPFRLQAGTAQNIDDDEFELQQATVTTCELPMERAHYRIQAGRVVIRPGDRLLAYHAIPYLGRVPVFYLPVWRASLDPDVGFTFQPGSSTRMGAYLLSSYRYRIHPVWRGETHLDYRTRRGPAFGQDLRWDDPATDRYSGWLSGYYLNDQDRFLDRDPESLDIDHARYRLQLQHRHRWSPRTSFDTRLEYVSDSVMREDFFERDYRRAVQPDNFFNWVHRRDRATFGLLGRMRLNDFYEHIDRLPEAELHVHRRRLGQAPVYYDSRHAAVALRHRRPRDDEDDISVTRLDTRHGLAWPTRSLGFLNIVPRAAVRGTYYSKTFATVTTEEMVTVVTTNEIIAADGTVQTSTTTESEMQTIRRRHERGADFRVAADFGVESSFQASRIWRTEPREWGEDLRHVVEPFMDYAFAPEPSLTPDQLHPFDRTDTLDKSHGVTFGVRNVLQTKRAQRSHDLLDVNVFSHYRLDAEDGENALGDIALRAEARPFDHWGMDMTAAYDPHEATLLEWNSRLFYRHAALWRADLDYRYRHEESRLISANLALTPVRDWTFEAYGRYEGESGRFQEHAWHAQRALDCMVIRTGFSHLPAYSRADGTRRDDEYRVTLELWLTAFPKMRSGISSRH